MELSDREALSLPWCGASPPVGTSVRCPCWVWCAAGGSIAVVECSGFVFLVAVVDRGRPWAESAWWGAGSAGCGLAVTCLWIGVSVGHNFLACGCGVKGWGMVFVSDF